MQAISSTSGSGTSAATSSRASELSSPPTTITSTGMPRSATQPPLMMPTAEASRKPVSAVAPMASGVPNRSEEHTSELQSLMSISYAVFCLKKKKNKKQHETLHLYTNKNHNSTIKTKHIKKNKPTD